MLFYCANKKKMTKKNFNERPFFFSDFKGKGVFLFVFLKLKDKIIPDHSINNI
jgi:hypothetical protein